MNKRSIRRCLLALSSVSMIALVAGMPRTAAAVPCHGINVVNPGTGSASVPIGAPLSVANGDVATIKGGGAVSLSDGFAATSSGGDGASQGVNGATTGTTCFSGIALDVESTSATASATVTTTALVTGGLGGGVLAQTAGSGNVSISTAAVDATGGGRGVEGDTASGFVTLTSSGNVSAVGDGVYANAAGAGDISINTAGVVSSSAANGIEVSATGTGQILIGSAAQPLGGPVSGNLSGIYVQGAGNVSVFAGAVSGGVNGVVALSNQSGANGVVIVNTTGAVTAGAGIGVQAINGGNLSTNTTSVTATGAIDSTSGAGVDAESLGGDVTVTTAAVTSHTGTLAADAIYASGAGDSLVTITTNGNVSGALNGVEVVDNGVAARDGISITANGAVTAGAGQTAILATNAGLGSISITTAAAGPISAPGGVGIGAQSTGSGAGNITISNAAQIGAAGVGQTTTGILAGVAAGNGGSINIASNGGAIFATTTGISATASGSGSVDIGASTGGISSAITTAGTGIFGSAASGNVAITTTTAGTIAPGATIGISAFSNSGNITINQAGDIGAAGVGNTVGEGIKATLASGSGSIVVHSTGSIYVTAPTLPYVGVYSDGIYAVTGGNGTITLTSHGVIDPGADGVYAQGGGAVSYTATGGSVEGGVGAFLQSTGTGAVSLTTTNATPITGLTGAGVSATSGAGGVTVTTSGVVTGATTGILAVSTGGGATSVTNNAAVFGGSGAGIDATSGTGGLTLNVNGNVTSTGAPAINATSAAGGVITLGPGVQVSGLVNTAGVGVINVTSASGSLTTLNIGAGATVSAAAGSAYNVVVKATGGSLTIDNDGDLTGRIDFSGLTGNNTGTLVNAPGTVFLTGGTSSFNTGNDNFVNSAEIETEGALTTFDFLGGVNIVTNTGLIRVGFDPVAASSFVLKSVTVFNNSGALDMQNGVVGDSIVAAGAAYIGSGNATLLIDANLGAPGAIADTLTVGTSAGSTTIAVHDTGAAFGAYNPTGVLVVSGTTHAGDFTLAHSSSDYDPTLFGGVLNKPGMFFYDLAVNGAGDTVLISAPKRETFELADLGASAQSIWYTTAPTSDDYGRRRDTLSLNQTQGAAAGPVVWATATGSLIGRTDNQTYSDLNKRYGYSTSYNQNIGVVTAGIDGMRRGAGSGAWLYGVSAGYVDALTSFRSSSTRASFEGAALSAYASYLQGVVFFDAAYTADLLNAKITAPNLAGLSATSSVVSQGGMVDIGLREPVGGGAAIEPLASVAYVRTIFGGLGAGGESISFNDPTSLRVSLGARLVGAAGETDGWRVSYTLSARAVDELDGQNSVLLAGQGPDLTLGDDFRKLYGDVGGGLKVAGKNGWSGFVDAGWMFNSTYSAPRLSLGGRYRF